MKAQNGTQDPTQLAHGPPSSWGTWAGLWVWAGPPYCQEVKSSFLPAPLSTLFFHPHSGHTLPGSHCVSSLCRLPAIMWASAAL